MVRFQSTSAGCRGRFVRLARFSAPVTAERVRWASHRSRSLATVRTTARADSRACSGSANSPNVRRSAGSTTANASVLSPASHPSARPSKPVVVQQPGQPAGNERGAPDARPPERVQPAGAAAGVGEQADVRVHRVDAVPEASFGRLVQGPHRGGQACPGIRPRSRRRPRPRSAAGNGRRPARGRPAATTRRPPARAPAHDPSVRSQGHPMRAADISGTGINNGGGQLVSS
jgi:hypothetical protein